MPEHALPSALPLTAAQHDIWLAQQIAPDSPVYTIAWFCEIGGGPDTDRLAHAVAAVVARTGSLHVRFPTGDDGRPVQQPVDPDTGGPRRVDLRAEPDPVAAAWEWMRADCAHPFDPASDVLHAQALLRISDDRVLWFQRYHHLVMDGYAVTLLTRAVAEVYGGGQPPRDWDLDRVVDADAAYRGSEQAAADAAFWTSHTDGAPEPVSVVGAGPTDAPDLAAHHTVEIPSGVHAVADRTGVRPARVAVAALAAYLARVSGTPDVVLSLPVAARPPALRDVPGMVSTVLPLWVRTGPGLSLDELAVRVDEEISALRPHTRHRGEDLTRAAGGRNLFGPGVNVQVQPSLTFGGHPARLRNVSLGPVGDVELAGYLEPEGSALPELTVDLRVHPSVDGPGVADHRDRLERFLTAALAEPSAPLAAIVLLTPDERATVVEERNDTAENQPSHTVWELVAASVAASPAGVALVDGDRRLTYADLDARTGELAAALAPQLTGPEPIVAIGLPRSAEMIVGILAVLRAGAAFVPLDPSWPADRRERVCRDAGVQVVLTGPGGVDDGLCVDLSDRAFDGSPSDVDVAGPQLAYVMFTSGSTGVPKGAMIRHEAICARLLWQVDLLGFGSGDASLFKAPLSFDISVNEILLPLVAGGRVVVAEPGAERDPRRMLELIATERVTFVYLVSSMLDALLTLESEDHGAGLAALRHVWCGGEVLTPELFARFRSAPSTSTTTMYHGYGPAEATIGVSHVVYSGDVPERIGTSIGRPNPNTRLYVLDATLNPVPDGVVGELYAGGYLLGRGYANRPGLTASTFVADPFGPPGERLYRTGDLARWSPDGTLDFAGRADNQVKIRGMRLELEEVEAALASSPAVRQVVVTARRNASGSSYLAGYVVGAGEDARPDRLREWASATLPEYMVPAAFVVLDRMPLTANGKVDRRALPEPVFRAAEYRAPSSATERKLCEAFAATLGVEQVGADDDFFALGGDSISAVALCAQARRRGLDVGPRELFGHRTPAAIATVAVPVSLQRAADGPLVTLSDDDRARVEELAGGPVEEVWPLSPLQEGLYVQSVLGGGDGGDQDVYSVQNVFDLDRRVELSRLRDAWDATVARHPSLRAGFVSDGLPGPLQFVAPRAVTPVEERDVADLDESERIIAEDRARPFDPDTPPLVRILLLHLPDGSDRLVLSHHAILWDGWSRRPLLHELFARYDGLEPEPGEGSFRDHLAWLGRQDGDAATDAWARALSGVDPTLVAPGATDPGAPSRRRRLTLPDALGSDLRTLARRHGVTLNSVLTAAMGLALGATTGTDDVVFGTTVAGRPAELPGVDDVVGLFLNTVPVRVALRPSETVPALLGRLQTERADLLEHEHLGLGAIQRAAGRSPLFDVLYVLQNFVSDDTFTELERREGITGHDVRDATHYPLTVVVAPGERITVRVENRPDLVDDEAAAAFVERLRVALEALAADDTRPVGALPTGPDATVGARTDRDYGTVSVADLLAERAALVPDDLAVVSGDERMTYAELDATVDRTARLLLSRGAGPERVVALGVPRSVESVVALFAVLRTGAAYLPLELDHPAERLVATMRDTQPVCLLTTSAVAASLADADVPAVVLDSPDVAAERAGLPVGPIPDAELGTFARTNPDRLEHPAYVIYTSGSTGRPKGVVTPYRGLTNMQVNHQAEIFGPAVEAAGGRRMRVAHTVSFAFDMSWEELLWLVEGHEVHVCDEELRRDGEALVAYCDAHAIDVVNVTPTYAAALFDLGLLDGHLPPLIMLGGEAVPASVWDMLRDRDGTFGYNLYGPTEYTINTLGAGTGESETSTVGRAILNTGAYVLDAWLRPVADGVPGELYIAGDGLARGYLGRFALTAERFVADPFVAGGRMYRTGDLVRRRRSDDGDGMLDFLGRTDDQVKIRGYRVEPGEVENVLAAHPAVERVAVVARELRAGQKQLAAYLVGRLLGTDDAVEQVRAHAARSLPDYMVPASLTVVDALPRTVNGKLDVAALPSPVFASAGPRRPPRDEVEKALCEIVADTLGLPAAEVGADDDFFALGGDSITAITLVGRARARDLPLDPREVFRRRTVSALAAYVRDEAGIADVDELPTGPLVTLDDEQWATLEALAPDGVDDVWPLSPLQEGLWFHAAQDAGGSAYTAQTALDFDERLDLDRLRTAWLAVLEENPAMRAGFTDDGMDAPVQLVAHVPDVVIHERAVDDDADLPAIMDAEHARPVDLARPPLVRLTVLHRTDGDRLLVTRPFLLWDGWSAALVLDRLMTRYRGSDPEPNGTYRDYLAWLATRTDTATSVEAWRTTLVGLEPTIVAPRLGTPGTEPERLYETLPVDVCDRLRAVARDRGVTLNSLLNAALGVVLGGATGRTDVAFGATVAGRPAELPDVDRTVGLFLNTVPVRVTLDPRQSLVDLAGQLQEQRVELMPHEHVGLGAIQRAAGQNELFDVLHVLQNFDDGADALARHGIADVHDRDHTHYPLAVVVAPGESIRLKLEYRADAVDADRAGGLLAHLAAVLTAVADEPDTPVIDAPAAEGVPGGLVGGVRDIGTETVADLLATQAERTPDALALVQGTTRLTYAELDARVNRIARVLLERAAGPEQVVALGLTRSPDMVAALFAVLRTGSAYLPLETDHPDERLLDLLDDARPVLGVATDAVAQRLAASDVDWVVPGPWLDDVDSGPIPDDALGTFARTNPDRLDLPAYVIYTSGSTGKPKGVVTPYRGLTNMQLNHQTEIFDPAVAAAGDRRMRVAHTVSFAFDMSWEELLWLVEGHEVHVCDEELRRDGTALVAYLRGHEVDVINVTPTYAAALIDEGLLDGYLPPLVMLGGEAVGDDVWSALRGTDGTFGYNLYGPTEYTINTLGAGTGDSPAPTVGRPILNTVAHVLDPWLRPVPQGVPGELYIAGAGLARGYLGRSGLTAERFVADPSVPGGRMYRTGDLVRQGPDGMLGFLGRTDDQVKIRGHRVEPGEVASVLSGHDRVSRAAVVADSRGGMKRLVGYVVPADGADPAPDELRRHLRERLPEHMVPAAVVVVDGLPLTVNGKLDVAALPAPDPVAAGSGRPPKGAREETLAGLFGEVLDVRKVSAEDSFFDLGGHSLLATRLLSRVRRALSAELALRDLFEAPTVAELAVRIDGHSGPALPELTVRERPERLPLSAAQQRLWLLQQLEAGSAAYNFPIVLRLTGDLDVEALRAALDDVADRHEALRTVFRDVDGVPAQRILDAVAVPFTAVDCTEGDVPARIAAELDRPFDLSTEVPLRATLLRTAPETHVLVLMLHHITTDEWSDRPFLSDLATAYRARRSGSASDPAPLPVQYADYALWHRELLGDADDPDSVAHAQLEWWAGELDGAPDELVLPADRPRPARPSFRGGTVHTALDGATGTGVAALAARTGASPFLVLHACVAAFLHRLGAGDDIVLGAPVAGRTDERLDELVGFFVNTLVLRTDVSGNPTADELVARVRDADLAAFSNADVPFEAVVERLNPPRTPARNPLFQVMVGYHARTGEALELDGVTAVEEPVEASSAKFDLVFSFTEWSAGGTRVGTDVDGALTLNLEYASDLYDEPTAARLASRFARFTRGLVTGSGGIGDVHVLDDDERALVLDGFNATDRVVEDRTLIEAFERNVASRPDAVAVVDGDRTLTYAELDGLAEGVAALLDGVGPEDVVGVAVPRSAEVVASVLGVLKRGAAFLPLDLSHPAERITFMLGDSGASALLATTSQSARVDTDVRRVLLPDSGIAPAGRTAYARPSGVDHAAYVIYTSGSTGRPKGAVLTHDGIASLAATAVDRMGVGADSVVLQFASIGFDVFVFELVQALHEGGRLVVLPDDARVAGPALTATMADAGVTHAILPPSLVAALPADQVIPDGTTVLVGTEVVPPHVIERWAGPLHLLGAYGLTEATVNSTLWDAVPGWEGPTPIGVPDPNTRTYVLDERLVPVPPGVAGDLYVAGRGQARGYLGRPDLTAERFVPCPFGEPGERMYRTGDRARWRADGNLDFLGRSDAQVKVRGFRIEPGEVASVLASHDDVAQAVVLPDRHGDVVRLVGYAAPAEGAAPDPAELRAHVADRLPEYMVPAVVPVLDGPLPLTPNGKVDERALPAPDWSALAGSRKPATAREQRLADLFAEVLDLPEVGVDDGFFDLGGHSMAVMRLIGRVRTELGVDLTVREVFDAPTVATLAALVDDAGGDVRPALVHRAGEEPGGALGPAQRWRWERHVAAGPDGSPADHALALWPEEPYDADALAAALTDVAARHTPLRTVFRPGPDHRSPVRRVVLDAGPELHREEVADLPARLRELAGAPADLGRELPLRAHLVTGSDGRQVLLLAMHYLGVDEWSVVPLLRDLGTAYAARRDGLRPEWTPLPVTYDDHVRWAADVLGDPSDPDSRHARQIDWWRNRLDGAAGPGPGHLQPARPTEGGPDGTATGDRDPRSEIRLFDLDADLHRDLTAVARRTRTSLFMVLRAALATVLTADGAGTDLVIGSFSAGRAERAVAGLVGCLTDVVALRTDVSGDPSFTTLLARVRDDGLAALDHEDVGFGDVADAAGIVRPRTVLVQHEQAGLDAEQGVLGRLEAIHPGAAAADVALAFYESPGDDPVTCTLTHRVAVVDERAAAATVEALLAVLRSAADDPDRPLSEQM